MALTNKQEKFSQAVASGSNYSDSYRSAYDCSKMKPETINRKAVELMKNGTIAARIDELKAEVAELALWSREQSVQALIDVINNHDKANDVIMAVRELNAMHGFNAPQKKEIEFAHKEIRIVDACVN